MLGEILRCIRNIHCFHLNGENGSPMSKANNAVLSKLSKTMLRLLYRFLVVGMSLAKKLVSITNYLFFPCFGHEILMRQGQIALDDILLAQSRTRMSFANASMERVSEFSQHLCANPSMTNIRLCSETKDTRRITLDDANIV